MLVLELGIEWDAELCFRHVEGSLMAEEPKEDSIVDTETVINIVELGSSDSSSSGSSSTYYINRYFGPSNCQNSGNNNGNSNSSNSSGDSNSDNDNGLI